MRRGWAELAHTTKVETLTGDSNLRPKNSTFVGIPRAELSLGMSVLIM